MTDGHNSAGGSDQQVGQARLEANWRAIEIELDAPRPAWPERLLRRLGVPSHMTRLALATPALRRSWYLAVAGVVILGLAAADPAAPRQSLLTLLTLAPLIPVLGVSLAYGSTSDGEHEMHLATPMRGVRLVAIRTFVVLAAAAVAITPLSLLNEVTRPYAAAWLLPSLAVTGSALALMTLTSPRRAAGLAAASWVLAVWVSQVGTDPLVAFTPVAQFLAAAVALAAGALTVSRRDRFDRLPAAP